MRTPLRRWMVAAALTVGAVSALMAPASPALGDVTVRPAEAVQGEEAAVTFAVSNDSTRETIVKVRVSVPVAAKLTSVRTKALSGWTAEVFKAKVPQPGDVCDCLAVPTVTSITWTAHQGVSIAPGAFEEFAVLVERLPKQASLTFGTTQTYADGTTVRSTGPSSGGAGTPSGHAPRLVLRAAPSGDAADLVPAAAKAAAPTTTTDPVARWLGLGALVVGVLGAGVLGAGALGVWTPDAGPIGQRRRRTRTDAG